jgi:outer membrane biosynthesis protein TonB
VSAEGSEEERLLRQEVEKSEGVLNAFEDVLRAADAEIDELTQKDPHYDLVRQICESLDKLEEFGAAALFWGRKSTADDRSDYLQRVRRKIESYHGEIASAEERRREIIEKIAEQNEALDSLQYDLQDAIAREESRKNEWIIERDEDEPPRREQIMPWSRGYEEDERFRRSLGASVLASLLLALLISSITVPIIEHLTVDELPERVAKLVRKPPPPPPPPPEPVVEEKLPEPEPEPEPEIAKEQPPEKVPESKEQPLVAETPPPKDTKEKVRSKGILAFRESFANRAKMRPTARLGAQAKLSSAGERAVGRPERMMVATSAQGSSGGINLSDISRDVGGEGGAIDGVDVVQVASSIEATAGVDRPLSSGAEAGRTDEEIQIVFDRNKAALYRLYNRELRKNPTLRGQLILQLTIEPDGSVSFCQLQSSDMNAPSLAQQVVERVSRFNFGAKEDVSAMTIIYPIDFLPAV